METQILDERIGWDLKKTGVFIGGTLLLIGTWCLLFMSTAAMTEGWLAPWDTVPVEFRPSLGSWQRSLNDSFEAWPGAILPGVIVVVVSASIFVIRTVRTMNRALLPLAFAATNFIFIVDDSFLATLAHRLPNLWLPQPRPPIDVGYHRTWPAMLVTTILLITLLLMQSKVILRRNRTDS